MWFLIRAAFWLSIVFALLPWPEDSGLQSSPPVAIWSRTRDAIGAAIGKARADSTKICTDSPLACLKAAVRLDQFAADKAANMAGAAGLGPGEIKAPSASQAKAPSPSLFKTAPASPRAEVGSQAKTSLAGLLKAALANPPPR